MDRRARNLSGRPDGLGAVRELGHLAGALRRARDGRKGALRIAAIGVSHWHSLWDSAYLRHARGFSDVQLVGLHDSSLAIASHRAQELGNPPVFTYYLEMIA